MRMIHGLQWLLALVIGASLLGCTGRSNRLPTVPVSGTVVYRGQPVENASVAFLAPGAPSPAFGTTDDAGRFRLTTFEPDDGAIVGRHVVTVRKLTTNSTPLAEPTSSQDKPIDPTAIDAAMQQQAEDLAKAEHTGSAIPKKYARRETSDLKVDVIEGDNNVKIVLMD